MFKRGGIYAVNLPHADVQEAEACHRQALSCAHGAKDEAFLNLGLILRASRRYREALEAANAALAIDPHYKAALALRTDLQLVVGQGSEA